MENSTKKLEGEWKSKSNERRKLLSDFVDTIDKDWRQNKRLTYLYKRLPIVRKDKSDLEYLITKNEINGNSWLNEVLKEKLNRVNRKLKRWSADVAIIKGAKKGETISQEIIQQCRMVSLEDLIEGEKFEQGNNRVKMRCPFHSEKSASFVIYRETNSAHCFGCKKTVQNAISYVMDVRKVEFLQAVEYLRKFI